MLLGLLLTVRPAAADEGPALHAGFAETDITPKLADGPLFIAGFGQNRKATASHDPLKARAVVIKHGSAKIAIVSVDLVGLFHANVARVRAALPGFRYVLVSSTHNHQGPDTLGLWGPHPFKSGVDPGYLKTLETQLVKAVQDAERSAQPVSVRIGSAKAPELLHDNREPIVKHDELVALCFDPNPNPPERGPAGIIVQWNCHPETLDSKNTQISADFVGYTVKELAEKYRCPVVYLSGTVGGLMTSLQVPIQDEKGKPLGDGTFAKTERYGRLVGRLAGKALSQAKAVRLEPLSVESRLVFLPLDNKFYVIAWQLGVLKRQAYRWTGDPSQAEPIDRADSKTPVCIRTELAWLRLGELDIAAIPGEIYPELILGKVQDPPDAGADFPDAPIEPAIYRQLAGPHRMVIGLANDEIGYIIPKRQWDEKPPFCYGRQQPQYGEINSLGPETAPILCKTLAELAKKR